MANGDNLADLIEMVRREMPDVPDEVWQRFTLLASLKYGASRVYIPAGKKRRHLEAMALADLNQDAEKLATILGLSVRRVQQLKRLR